MVVTPSDHCANLLRPLLVVPGRDREVIGPEGGALGALSLLTTTVSARPPALPVTNSLPSPAIPRRRTVSLPRPGADRERKGLCPCPPHFTRPHSRSSSTARGSPPGSPRWPLR